jgi:transposase-like protein
MDVPRTLQQAIEYFSDADRCHAFAVAMRWPSGVACPTCGEVEPRFISTRRLFECKSKHARRQFSVKVGTIFEDSPIALKSWLLAMWMVANCKNGVSSYEVARAIGVTQKSAWFMLHRIRLAMQDGETGGKLNGTVEVDETYIGGKTRNRAKSTSSTPGRPGRKAGRGGTFHGKTLVMGLLERATSTSTKRVRTTVIPHIKKNIIGPAVRERVEPGAALMTDALASYRHLGDSYEHKFVDHATSYVDGNVHTNGIENFWCLLKRTIKGTYVSVEPFHLFRYLDEQAHRFNRCKWTDAERFEDALKTIVGRRLTYAALTAQEATA